MTNKCFAPVRTPVLLQNSRGPCSAGSTGDTGATGAKGKTGGDTLIVVPPSR
jgi:hypothetical protein